VHFFEFSLCSSATDAYSLVLNSSAGVCSFLQTWCAVLRPFVSFLMPCYCDGGSNSIDNSEWMRNGDYVPTRMASQADAVNLICSAKIQNPESAVGVMTMASRRFLLLHYTAALARLPAVLPLKFELCKLMFL
jgi:hypothetical protein